MYSDRGEATNFRGEATGDRGEATGDRGEAINFRGEATGDRGEATNFRGEATGGNQWPLHKWIDHRNEVKTHMDDVKAALISYIY